MSCGNLKKGDRVTIYNCTLSGRTIIEGKARLIKDLKRNLNEKCHSGGWQMWEVEFENELGEKYERWVDPKQQLEGKDKNTKKIKVKK